MYGSRMDYLYTLLFAERAGGGSIPVTVCRGCGSIVFDKQVHDEFHLRLEETESLAYNARFA